MPKLKKPPRHLSDSEVSDLSSVQTIDDFPASFKRPTLSPKCSLRASELGGKGVFAIDYIEAGETVLYADGEKFDRPVVYSFQYSDDVHTMGVGALNHKCEPSCGVDPKTGNIVSLVAIDAGQELAFNYLTTEWEMAAIFECGCGSKACYRTIKGFRHLNGDERSRLLSMLPVAEHIRDKC